MAKNFMEAGTEIDALINQKRDINKKIGINVAAAIISRVNSGKDTSSLARDIDNLLGNLSNDEKYQVMVLAAVEVAKVNANRSSGGNNHNRSRSSERSSLFDRF